MSSSSVAAPGIVRSDSLGSIAVEQLNCNIGAEVLGINLGDAARDDILFDEVRALFLKCKVLYFRD